MKFFIKTILIFTILTNVYGESNIANRRFPQEFIFVYDFSIISRNSKDSIDYKLTVDKFLGVINVYFKKSNMRDFEIKSTSLIDENIFGKLYKYYEYLLNENITLSLSSNICNMIPHKKDKLYLGLEYNDFKIVSGNSGCWEINKILPYSYLGKQYTFFIKGYLEQFID